jgi:hypothetical protein
MDVHLILYYIGISIVFVTHVLMLVTSENPKMKMHAVINVVAGLFIAYYFMAKEKYITF